ncbi:c-type cytochrome biogenesis protein CcmI [Aliirhizobium smilacinae]|uniref:C-type cytochrome biogenesis protein CcmI n=1 Tax=Aliirhizobium smilacinae TaxID=1395944 RepID=A0A5C4XQD7_9HYPH|nr:c-type cytochrome biogenesis protein CcmI [Rhizobium smilacinae]TNM65632.1 c-type cytochrome biogenesis protein CcmI [Rhizobium smilacinae]
MILWILLALLTAIVAAALLYPLSRRPEALAPENAGEIAVYRDQMKELDRDRAGGLISAEEAEYARAEIGRRLLAAAAKSGEGAGDASKPSIVRKLAIGVVTVVPPAIGLCLYIMLGSPGLPDQPLEARLENPGNDMSLLVAKAERHLAQNPNDGAGWDILAPIYFRTARLGDAELAYRNAIRLIGPNGARLSGLGETLVVANDGIVTEDARSAFEEAIRLEPGNVRARFYVGVAQEQAGKAADAKATFEAIAKASPPDAPWMGMINEHIAKNGGTAAAPAAPSTLGGPSADDVAAAQNMSQGDRQEMIRGMVDSLAARLEADPNNIEGWLRLVRSYMVLGDRDKAQAALKTGLGHFPADGNEGRQLAALAQETGLSAEGVANPGGTQ